MEHSPADMPDPKDFKRPRFYKMRLVKGGPYVGAMIAYGPPKDPETGETLDRSYMWEAWINGQLTREPSPDPERAAIMKIWLFGNDISESDYRYLIDDREWCRKYAPMTPEAAPTQKADLSKALPIF